MGGSWQPGRAGQHVAKSPGAPLAGCALDNLAFQLQHGDKQYVMRRVLYGKCSASGKHPDASMLGTCGSSCALEGQGGKHVDGIVYGVARPLHKEMRIGTKLSLTASQVATQSQMAASVVGSHKLTEGDHTGVLTDSKASAALGSARRRLLLTNDPADLGVSMVVHWHKDHGEAYDPQAPSALQRRASIHDDGDTYIVTLTSHNLLKTVVEV